MDRVRDRRLLLDWAAVVAGAVLVSLLLDLDGAMVVAGAVLGVGIALVSRWWSRIYVAELRGEL